jgi:hypothetical protein
LGVIVAFKGVEIRHYLLLLGKTARSGPESALLEKLLFNAIAYTRRVMNLTLVPCWTQLLFGRCKDSSHCGYDHQLTKFKQQLRSLRLHQGPVLLQARRHGRVLQWAGDHEQVGFDGQRAGNAEEQGEVGDYCEEGSVQREVLYGGESVLGADGDRWESVISIIDAFMMGKEAFAPGHRRL